MASVVAVGPGPVTGVVLVVGFAALTVPVVLVALVALVDVLRSGGDDDRRLLDVQWATEHLAGLGAVEVPRPDYLRRLTDALPLPDPFAT